MRPKQIVKVCVDVAMTLGLLFWIWTFEQEVLTMPHIAITMIPGRDDETKQALALKTQALLAGALGIDPEFV